MKSKNWLNLLGNLFICLGVLIIFLTFFPVALQEARYQIIYKPSFNQNNKTEIITQAKEIKPVSFDFSLVIPKIGVNSLVFPNIDSGSEEKYLPILKKGVAHAKGSSLPDRPGAVFIFAHSTNNFFNITHYNAVFFLLNKLRINDEAFIYYQQKKYHYQVSEKKIIENNQIPDEVAKIQGNALVLQTCWPPGTTLKRLLVIAKQIN